MFSHWEDNAKKNEKFLVSQKWMKWKNLYGHVKPNEFILDLYL